MLDLVRTGVPNIITSRTPALAAISSWCCNTGLPPIGTKAFGMLAATEARPCSLSARQNNQFGNHASVRASHSPFSRASSSMARTTAWAEVRRGDQPNLDIFRVS